MPEEINRIVTDAISDWYFVTEESGVSHLRKEGKPDSVIFHVGHVMIDNLFHELARLKHETIGLERSTEIKNGLERYGVVTLHRPSNVDASVVLEGIIDALTTISNSLPLVFPIHPRTRAAISRHRLTLPPGILSTEPLGYRDFLNLWRDATLVLTDSGGLQEESTALGVPCLTLRENTERPVTVTEGSNVVVGTSPNAIVAAASSILDRHLVSTSIRRPPLWDGRASERILDQLGALLSFQP